MNKQEMLEEYGDIPLRFKSWYKNEFTLTASWVNDIDDHDKLLVIFAPDYRDYLGFQVNTTIRELIQNDDHAHLSILDGWEDELSISGIPKRKQVYYGEGEL
tara:strand:- start:7728 stop:8033 length:306 start_codon:yes stop_codon:yes gene_type:complete